MKRYEESTKERQLAQAMMNIRLRCRSEYNTLLQWFTDSRQDQQDTNDELSGEDASKGKGYSLCLRDIITELDSAPQSLAAIQGVGSES